MTQTNNQDGPIALSTTADSQSDTPETDIFHDHCHIGNTPAPEAIDEWVEKCRKLERERNSYKREIMEFRNSLGCTGGESWQMGLARLWGRLPAENRGGVSWRGAQRLGVDTTVWIDTGLVRWKVV